MSEINKRDYAAWAEACKTLLGGGTHTKSNLFPATHRFAFSGRALQTLRRAGAIREAATGLWQVSNQNVLQGIWENERRFCATAGWDGLSHDRHAAVYLRDDSGIRDLARSYDPLLAAVGAAGLKARFHTHGMRSQHIRACRMFSDAVLRAIDESGLTLRQSAALAVSGLSEPVLLALVDLVSAHQLSSVDAGRLAQAMLAGIQKEGAGSYSVSDAYAAVFGAASCTEPEEEATERGPGNVDLDEAVGAVVKVSTASLELLVEIRNQLVRLGPRIEYLASELGYKES